MGCAGRGGVTCASAASSAWDSAGPKPWRAGGATTPSVATRSLVRLMRSNEAAVGHDVVCASHVRGGQQPANSAIEIARITLRLTSRASEHRPVGAATGEVYTARAIWESRRAGPCDHRRPQKMAGTRRAKTPSRLRPVEVSMVPVGGWLKVLNEGPDAF